MRNKRALVALCLMLSCLLSGCRFAAEEKSAAQDKFSGISIRLEDMGEPAGTDENGNPYYQPEQEETQIELTDEQTRALLSGKPIDLGESGEYPVGDIYCYVCKWTDEQGGESTGLEQDNWPGKVKSHITITDEEEKYESDTVVYITGDAFREDAKELVILHMDSVYVKPDGTAYARREGGSVSGSIDGFSREIKTESAVTGTDGKRKSETVRVKATIEWVNELTDAHIAAFDASGEMLGRTELNWRGAEKPIPYAIPENAAYLILEETGIDMRGASETQRTLCNLPLADGGNLFTLKISDGTGFAYPFDVIAE